MDPATVTKLDDVSRHTAAIVLAFAGDPFVRWFLPEPDVYLRSFTEITRSHGERSATHDAAFGRADGRGTAFWFPPGVGPDLDAMGRVLSEAGSADRVKAVFDAADAHHPDEPHFYLRQIGIDPRLQGTGQGSALLAAGLAMVDAAQALAYLEATSNASRLLYERHGFITLAEVTAGGSPPLWPMLRPATA